MTIDKQLVRYGAVGAFSAFIDLSLFSIFVYFGLNPPLVGSATYLLGTITSYVLNRKITFNRSDKVILRGALFISVSLIGAAFTSVLLIWTNGLAGLTPIFWRIATLPIVFLIQFLLNKHITFSKLKFDSGVK